MFSAVSSVTLVSKTGSWSSGFSVTDSDVSSVGVSSFLTLSNDDASSACEVGLVSLVPSVFTSTSSVTGSVVAMC